MAAADSQLQHSYLDELPRVASNTDSNRSHLQPPLTDDRTKTPVGDKSIPDKSNIRETPSTARAITSKRDLQRQFIKIFLASLSILQTVKAIGTLLRARRSTRSLRRALQLFLRALFKADRSNLKSSVFFSAYPVLYRLWTQRSSRVSEQGFPEAYNIHRDSSHKKTSLNARTRRFIENALPVLLLGPLANLLPGAIITQLNLYAVSAAGMACARVLNDKVQESLADWQETVDGERNADLRGGQRSPYVPYFMTQPSKGPSESVDKHFSFLDKPSNLSSLDSARYAVSSTSLAAAQLVWKALSSGGGWWLFPLTQGLLLDTAVFEGDCFPSSYKNVIVARSKRYLPSASNLGLPEASSLGFSLPPPSSILSLLPLFTVPPFPHPPFPLSVESSTVSSLFSSHVLRAQYAPFLPILQLANPAHSRAMCATLHPLEPSCFVNFLASVKETIGSAFALVGGYSGVMMLSKFKKLKQSPKATLLRWLVSSLRGAGFVTLAISNAWAWVCVFQRLLKPETLTRSRFGLGGMLAGLWVFLVPAARRLELGLYSVRLSMLTLWKIGTKKGWWTPRRRLGFAPFALALAILVHIKRQRLAPMEGWVGKGVTWLDADYDRSSKARSESVL